MTGVSASYKETAAGRGDYHRKKDFVRRNRLTGAVPILISPHHHWVCKEKERAGGEGLCKEIVGQAFEPDPTIPGSMNRGKLRQPGKADLQLRCKAGGELAFEG